SPQSHSLLPSRPLLFWPSLAHDGLNPSHPSARTRPRQQDPRLDLRRDLLRHRAVVADPACDVVPDAQLCLEQPGRVPPLAARRLPLPPLRRFRPVTRATAREHPLPELLRIPLRITRELLVPVVEDVGELARELRVPLHPLGAEKGRERGREP